MALPNKQAELDFLAKYQFTPLTLLYLNLIYMGEFDKRLQRGEFTSHERFSSTISSLLDAGLIKYAGCHSLTPRGSAHIIELLDTKVQP